MTNLFVVVAVVAAVVVRCYCRYSISSLKAALVQHSKIPKEDQIILLEGGVELSDETFLATCGVPWVCVCRGFLIMG